MTCKLCRFHFRLCNSNRHTFAVFLRLCLLEGAGIPPIGVLGGRGLKESSYVSATDRTDQHRDGVGSPGRRPGAGRRLRHCPAPFAPRADIEAGGAAGRCRDRGRLPALFISRGACLNPGPGRRQRLRQWQAGDGQSQAQRVYQAETALFHDGFARHTGRDQAGNHQLGGHRRQAADIDRQCGGHQCLARHL